jgi:predicted DNA-binding transcriptional regulator AlpA
MGTDTPAVRLISAPGDGPPPTPPDPLAHLRDRPEATQLSPLLIDMANLSQILARSEASLYRDDAAGRISAGRKLGASKRWVYAEIVAWVEAGMPDRRTWEAMKNSRTANGRPRS